MSKNEKQIVLGKVSGLYNSSNYEIIIGDLWYKTKILCNGKELKNVRKIEIIVEAGCPTIVKIEFADLLER
jgi:hypothetical protein